MPYTFRSSRTHARWAAALTASLALALGVAPGAEAGWREPAPGPVNDSIGPAESPALTVIDGVPYMVRTEWDGTNHEVRVARLNAAGDGWDEVAGGESPINHSPFEDAEDPSIASVGGVPWVAWSERQGPAYVERVSRLNAAGTAWEEVGDGASPSVDNHFSLGSAITVAGGVPYVTWSEHNHSIHASRLDAAGTGWEELETYLLHPGGTPVSMATVGGVPYVAYAEVGAGCTFVGRLNGAGTGFEPVGGAASCGFEPTIASVGGVPYVASTQQDAGTYQIRVDRLNASGTGWEQVVVGHSTVNHSADQSGFFPSIAAVDGVPYVAWTETVPGNDRGYDQLHVSRLNAAGTAWDEVGGGDSPLGMPLDHYSDHPSLVGIGGVPYVAWADTGPGYTDVRASRFEPDFLAQGALATDREALMLSLVRTSGVPYPIAFQYGEHGLGHRTATTRTTADLDEDTVVQKISGLEPATVFSWRPIGFDGFRPAGAGPTATFTTRPTPEPRVRLLIAVLPPRLRATVGERVTVPYLSTRSAATTLEVRRHGVVLVEKGGRAHPGRNELTWNGRIRGVPAEPGRYVLVVAATAGGQAALDRVRLQVVRRGAG